MLQLGCAVADITPRAGTSLSGFIFRAGRPAEVVDDPLRVRALALRSANGLHLLLNYDLLGIGEPLQERILGELQHGLGGVFSRQRCVLTATHTHSGPPTIQLEGEPTADPEYWDLLCARSLDAARSALHELQPVSLQRASVHMPGLTYNRRAVLANGRVSMAAEPDSAVTERGPVDDRLTLLVWRNGAGKNVALLAHFACHGVAVCTQAVTADIPGQVAGRLGEIFGAPCLFLQGTAGDVNPTVVAAGRAEMLAWTDRATQRLRTLAHELRPVSSEPVRTATGQLLLQYAALPRREQVRENLIALEALARGDLASPEAVQVMRSLSNIMNIRPGEPLNMERLAYAAGVWAETEKRVLGAVEAEGPPAGRPLRLSAWRVGDTVLVFVAAELLAETGLRIQALRDDLTILPVTCVAPVVGYIPDRDTMKKGGYEVTDGWRFYGHPASFHPESEERLLDALRVLIARLQSAS